MYECKYKLELNDCIKCAKYVYKSQKRKQDKIMAALIPVLMVGMLAMLIFDIVNHKSIVWDIVLIGALIVLECMYLIIPLMLVSSQKKSFKSQKLSTMDYLHIKIDDNLCVETLLKDEKEMAKNIHNLKQLTSYIEDKESLILVFNNVEFVNVKKQFLTGGLDKLKQHLTKIMSKSQIRKK